MNLGLRIDVDTLRGTRTGVPGLCRVLRETGVRGTFFFSVGPDNMGRHLSRLLRPRFFLKMLRSGAPSLYGWDILLRGTLGPGPCIGRRVPWALRLAEKEGHEMGLHAWDHQAWQSQVEGLQDPAILSALTKGYDLLCKVLDHPPTCSAAPAWNCPERVLPLKETLPFRFNSDCRGTNIFLPVLEGRPLTQPQVPVTLPTYDEVIGRGGVTTGTYNAWLLSRASGQDFSVLTIHAEVEGIACLSLFRDFLRGALARGIRPMPLGELLDRAPRPLPQGAFTTGEIPGREGRVTLQTTA